MNKLNYRNTRNYENVEKMLFDGDGEFNIPRIEPIEFEGECDFISFNYAPSTKQRNGKGVHFFLDDYQFERLWKTPNKYLSMLSDFDYVLTPDFSTYTDFPKALQIYNHYRKHWIGAYFQRYNINVIPTISWSTEDSFEWCFDGEPIGGTVAVSSVGTQNSIWGKELFINGYNKMLEILKPTTILFHGKVPEECKGNIIKIKCFTDKFNKETLPWEEEVQAEDLVEKTVCLKKKLN